MLIADRVTRPKLRCRRCQQPLLKGDICLHQDYLEGVEFPVPYWYHPMCMVDVSAWEVSDFLKRDRVEFPRRKEIAELVKKRMAAITALNSRKSPASKIDIEPARDPFGRPRVRVFFGGSLASGEASVLDSAFSLIAMDYTICSPLREYVLNPFAGGRGQQQADPSQPTVGAIFAHYSDVKVVRGQKEKVAQWKAMGLPTPLLWVHQRTPARPEVRDATVLALRSMLDSVGYVGDEALVLVTELMTEADLALVGLKLDEALQEGSSPKSVQKASKSEHLESIVRAGNTDAYVSALELAVQSIRTLSDAEKEALSVSASKCLTFAPARLPALRLLTQLKASPQKDAVRTVMTELLNEKSAGRQYPKEFILAAQLLEHWGDEFRFNPLWTAYSNPSLNPTRRAQIQPFLSKHVNKDFADTVQGWLDKLKAKDPRRAPTTKLLRSLNAKLQRLAVSAQTA